LRYDFEFDSSAGTLEEEGAVTLLGFEVGEVESAQLKYDERTGKPFTLVTALLYPQRLDVTLRGSNGDWRSATDARLRDLIRDGYRARLQRTPALVGNQSIALVRVKDATRADLAHDSENPTIPSVPGSTEAIASQVEELLAKLNSVPIERIGENIEQVTNRLRDLTSSPKMAQSVEHLNHTLAELDQILGQVAPQVGSLVTKLNDAAVQISATALVARQLLGSDGAVQGESVAETLQQLNDASRAVRALADYLDRHPESLILGKRPSK
jgi:paraquat-inducible protein B